jgi:PhnB protein
MRIAPYLTLDGTTRSAFDFYARTLGGDVVSMMTFGEGDMPDECHDRIMHPAMVADGQMLMASDSMPGQFEGSKAMAISLHVDRPADAETLFKAMSESGQVTMAMAPTCWAERFGMLVGLFDVSWIFNGAGDRGSCVES